jgi:hypothetical protein
MTTSTVNGKLVNPAIAALDDAQVILTLVDYNDQPVAGFEVTDSYEVIDAVTVTPDATGTWTAALVPNAELQTADGTGETAYRVQESGGAAGTTYWIVVTDTSPSWVGDLITNEVGPAAPGELPGTWCTVTDVLTFTSRPVTQADVNVAQQMIEAIVRRVWRETDSTTRDYYWLQRATAWQARYVNAHPEVVDMMDVQSISQDGLGITFKPGAQMAVLYSPITLRLLNDLYRGSNTTIRYNSAFQKNRLTKVGVTAGSSIPWNNL